MAFLAYHHYYHHHHHFTRLRNLGPVSPKTKASSPSFNVAILVPHIFTRARRSLNYSFLLLVAPSVHPRWKAHDKRRRKKIIFLLAISCIVTYEVIISTA